jgi:phospho-N-acetylmuramoyl-pentapeptide-transferase
MLLSPIYLKYASKVGAGQHTLKYLKQHASKTGTPTMGGMVFVLTTSIIVGVTGGFKSSLTLVITLIFIGFGLIGFLDDLIKVIFKRNLGLRAYQKIFAQLLISIIAAWFCANNRYIGTSIYIPVIRNYFDLGIFYIPFATFVFVASTNAVNLTDGLDGLAASMNVIYFATFLIVALQLLSTASYGGDLLYEYELKKITIFLGAIIGGLIGFLWFNGHKSQMIMGDTGALALGAVSGAIALFLRNPLLILLVGIMFVVTSMSVFIQILSFKLTKKRIFLMAPLHHHLELKGLGESKIVTYYSIITIIMGVVSLIVI